MPRHILLLLLLLSVPASAQEAGIDRPNVILIVSDDQGTIDLGSFGADDLHTPHLDALAERGVRLTQFCVAAPICSPSRGALLTGRYPQRNGVVTNSRPFYEGEITLAELLKGAGYRTGQFGKWHIGHGRPNAEYAQAPGPNDEGFDYAVGFLGGVIDKWSHFNYGGAPWGDPPRRHDLHRNGKEIWESGVHSGDLIVREAGDFMAAHRDAPFFLYVAFGSPHYPMQPYDRHRARYADLPEPRRAYAALVTTMDEQIGRLLDRVDALGLRENTLVVFLSDHGHSTEERANLGGGSAGPYRGAKMSLFEGGIRAPAIVSFPGRLPAGEARDQLTTAMDLFPTIAALTHTALPDRPLDGRSLLPILTSADAPTPHETVYWHRPGSPDPQWAVRHGTWKLVVNARDTDRTLVPESERIFLSRMDIDATERRNLAAEHPDIVGRLTAMHGIWLAEVTAGN